MIQENVSNKGSVPSVLVVVFNIKGGVGKSFSCKLSYEAACRKYGKENVILIDCDTLNLGTYQAYPNDCQPLDLSNQDHLNRLLQFSEENTGKVIIVDMPAGEGEQLQNIFGANGIATFIETFTDEGFKVKVMVPVNDDIACTGGLEKIYQIWGPTVEYHIVKNMRTVSLEKNYSFNALDAGSTRKVAEEQMKVDLLVQSPDETGGLFGYTKNCVLISQIDPEAYKLFIQANGSQNLSAISIDNIHKVVLKPARKALAQFYEKVVGRFEASELFN